MWNSKCPTPAILPKGTLAPNSGNMSGAMLRAQALRITKATNSCGTGGATGNDGATGPTGATGPPVLISGGPGYIPFINNTGGLTSSSEFTFNNGLNCNSIHSTYTSNAFEPTYAYPINVGKIGYHFTIPVDAITYNGSTLIAQLTYSPGVWLIETNCFMQFTSSLTLSYNNSYALNANYAITYNTSNSYGRLSAIYVVDAESLIYIMAISNDSTSKTLSNIFISNTRIA